MKLVLLVLLIALVSWWIPAHGLAYFPQPQKTAVVYCDKSSFSDAYGMEMELRRAGVSAYCMNISNDDVARKNLAADLLDCKWGTRRMTHYPVVVYNHRTILVDPEVKEIIKVTSRPVFSWKTVKKEWLSEGPVAFLFAKDAR